MARSIKPGEAQVVLASEEVQRRNIQSMMGHGNETRKLVRELEGKVKKLEQSLNSQNQIIANLQIQLAGIHAKLARGGTTVH